MHDGSAPRPGAGAARTGGPARIRNRWSVLAALTLARATMAAAFQSVAALAGPMMAEAGFGWTGVGALVGAFMLPGVAASLAGGWLGQRFGARRVAIAGLLVMSAAGFAMALASGFDALLAARLGVGIGAVGLNVMLTKMAADWFPGRDLPTAMGVLSASWPGGIALALLILPPAGEALGWRAAAAGAAALALPAAALLAAVPPTPPGAAPPGRLAGGLLAREWALTLIAALVWGLYNAGLATALAFSADLLAARGREAVEAAAAASWISWGCLATIALGGWAAARSRRPDLVTALSLGASAAGLALFGAAEAGAAAPLLLAAIGLAIGPAAGPILALTAQAARPEARALAFGVFFALYYAVFGGGPALAGLLRDVTADAAVPAFAAAAMVGAALALYALFRAIRPVVPPA